MGCIYLAQCKVNGKGYIGLAVDFGRRIRGHRDAAENGCSNIFYHAIRKHGWDSFEWSILYEDDDNDLEWLGWWERKFIRQLKTKSPNGYNMTDGGEGTLGLKWKDDSKRKLSETKKLVPSKWYGPRSEEYKEKISESLMGHPVSESTREKLRQLQTGKPGTPHTPESKEKIAASKRGKKRSPETLQKMSESMTEKWKDPTYRSKVRKAMSLGQIGRTVSEETREKIRKSNTGRVISQESREKMSRAAKTRASKIPPEEMKAMMANVRKKK